MSFQSSLPFDPALLMMAAFKNYLERHDINPRQVRTMFVVYLKQDLRGSKAFRSMSKGEYLTSNRALLVSIGMYVLLGLVMGTAAFRNVDVLIYSMIILSYTLFIVALALVAESGNVIFNESEIDVVGHLPISARTLFAAKLLNLLAFTGTLAGAANLFPTVFGIWARGSSILFVPAHLISAACVALFATSSIVVSYGFLMRFVGKERFDNIIAYSQIVLALVFMIGYQVLPRLLGSGNVAMISGFRDYFLLFPPAWFSGITMLGIGRIELSSLALAALGVLALAILGRVAVGKVAQNYSSFSSDLAFPVSPKAGRVEVTSNRGPDGVFRPATRFAVALAWYLPNPVERAVFGLVAVYLRRNREIKVRLYPALAYFIFIPLLALFSEGLHDPFNHRGWSISPLMGGEMICFVMLSMLDGFVFSEHYLAAYIFDIAPIEKVALIYRGFRKAVLAYLAVPAFLSLFLLYSILWRNPVHALLLLLPWAAIAPSTLLFPFLLGRRIPLSRKYQKGQQSSRNLVLFTFCFMALCLILVLQLVSVRGYISYPLFLGATVVGSTIVYFAGNRFIGSGPVPHSESA